jgi:thioredoxin reductase (NADPH)
MKHAKLIIVGSGPAAYTAAIYAARANLEPIIFEGFYSGVAGGQLMTTTEVENFPGFPEGVTGPELMDLMKKQAQKFGTKILPEDVVSVDLSRKPFKVNGSSTHFTTDSLVLATGATAKRLDVPGTLDGQFWQKGVTACAVCDGAAPLFRQKDLYVVGGGDTAIEEALFLTKYAKHVYIIHRRDELRASKIMAKRALDNPKVTVLWNSVLKEVTGDTVVRHVVIENVLTNERKTYEAGGLFFAIGHTPNTGFLNNQIDLHETGYISVKPGTTRTSVEGVFAAGDVQDAQYRQAITAAGSGCMAALDAERHLAHLEVHV